MCIRDSPQDKENFCGMTIKGMVFDEKKAAGERLMLACKEMPLSLIHILTDEEKEQRTTVQEENGYKVGDDVMVDLPTGTIEGTICLLYTSRCV